MTEYLAHDSADQLGRIVFHLMYELAQISEDPASTPADIEAARTRLQRTRDEIFNGPHDVSGYDVGLRGAAMTHLSMCESARREPVTLAIPRSPDEVHTLKVQAQAIRAGVDELQHLQPAVRERVADVYLAHASLSEAIRESGEPSVLLLRGIGGEEARPAQPLTSMGGEADWYTAGKRHWELATTVGSHDDDHPECESAREELEALRDHIPDLCADQIRDYLNGLIEEIEAFAWHGM